MALLEELEMREGFRRLVKRRGSGVVPGRCHIHPLVWDSGPAILQKAADESPHVVVTHSRNPEREKESTWTDLWGCTWHFPGDYLDGQVIEHPLASWDAYADYELPLVEKYRDWKALAERIADENAEGTLAWGGVEHGFIYLRLTYLRGFQNFMIDVAEKRSELHELIERMVDYWIAVCRRFIESGVDAISFGDDLGHQTTLPISPAAWRDLLKPAFRKVFHVCHEAGVLVYLHTDGWIVDIIQDLIETGVDVLNPQDFVNGLDNLKRLAHGKVCIDLDIDRQSVTAFGTPAEVDAHLKNCVETLGSSTGGLLMIYGGYPGTPAENAAAVIRSMERYHAMWVEK